MHKTLILLLIISFSTTGKAGDSTFHFTTSDSVKLFVRVAGKGNPCVFVHGGPGSTSYYFEATTAAKILEQGIRMVYYDQRGSGRSGSASNNDYSAARFVKDLEDLRAHLHINQWHVMGHSFCRFFPHRICAAIPAKY